MSKRIITVLGATGAQGGGLARKALADGQFTVRAVTRNPDGEKAAALKALGAEVVQADLESQASLHKAFAGSYGVFAVTNFWEHFSVDKEQQHAKNIAEAAKAAGVEHVVWSTLEDTRKHVPLEDTRMPTLKEKYKVPHFDGKGEADGYFDQAKTTFLLTSFYWDNLIYFGMNPKPGPDGKLAFTVPMADQKLPGIAAADIGKCAYGIFKREDLKGKYVGIMGDAPTGAEMAATLSKGLGQEVVYNGVPFDVFRGFGFPGSDDLGNMFQFKAQFPEVFQGNRSAVLSKELNPELMDFEQWVAQNKDKIPLK